MNIREKLIDATIEIFTSMVMMDVSVVDEEITESTIINNSITGLIGLAGTHKGVLALHFPYDVAFAITGSFLGMDVTEMNEDVEDAVGELANMLGGNMKTILSEKGRDIELSLPSTISGSQYDFQPTKDSDKILLSFSMESGNFLVEVLLEK